MHLLTLKLTSYLHSYQLCIIMSDHHKRNSYTRSHSKSYAIKTNSWMYGDEKLQNWRASPDKGEETSTLRRDRTLITVLILYQLWNLILMDVAWKCARTAQFFHFF